MDIEIERKFLVKDTTYKKESYDCRYIKQGFLNSNKNRVVRIRIIDKKAFLTIKGKSNKKGTTRFEWEKEISVSDAENLFLLCEKGIIEKYRYYIKSNKHVFEVDEFLGDNIGLVVAEIELENENDDFKTPKWLGKEVTGISKYYNSNLSKKPYKSWA
ncbi:CYTH domain-containing protein [Lutibacter sp. Hel_I_33_5]|uniref:CYTH domain-containing protein n=1 Tax=Lutibacter sp. Hel_I_33_5 TaxID=1566289 RepID=UPI0011A3C752|nr:CYTH domain-containing protein [Lutibacter sp. Hel_I_33_5]TVZ56216.1 CYTH domain-containing protein [Lutibacter sp. Hel_I_33_5]